MTSHTWNAIRALLDAKLLTLSGITAAKVCFPGAPFTPPSGRWWKVDLLPARTDAALGLGGRTYEQGVYQITVFEDPGAGQPGSIMGAADAVVAHFDRATLSSVQCAIPQPGPLMEEPGRIGIPVSVPFTAL